MSFFISFQNFIISAQKLSHNVKLVLAFCSSWSFSMWKFIKHTFSYPYHVFMSTPTFRELKQLCKGFVLSFRFDLKYSCESGVAALGGILLTTSFDFQFIFENRVDFRMVKIHFVENILCP